MSKVGDPSPTADVALLFPDVAVPSRTLAIPRLLCPFVARPARNTAHFTTQGRLAQVKAQWLSLSPAQTAAWDSWANANLPWDETWACDFPWSGQLAHGQCNMRLLFLGASMRAAPPTVPQPDWPALSAYGWSYPTPNELSISWYEPGSPSLTAIISIRMLPALSGLKSLQYTIPIVGVTSPDATYTITNPTGLRCWISIIIVHNTQGHCSWPVKISLDRGVV